MKLLLLSIGVIALQACAHNKTEKQIEAKTAEETHIRNRTDLHNEVHAQIESSSTLTSDQKTKLHALSESTRASVDELTSKSLKLRSVLLKDVIDSKYNAKEVSKIKKDIKRVEAEKLSVIFAAVDQANAILGRSANDNQHLIRNFLFERTAGAHDR